MTQRGRRNRYASCVLCRKALTVNVSGVLHDHRCTPDPNIVKYVDYTNLEYRTLAAEKLAPLLTQFAPNLLTTGRTMKFIRNDKIIPEPLCPWKVNIFTHNTYVNAAIRNDFKVARVRANGYTRLVPGRFYFDTKAKTMTFERSTK